MPDPTPAQLRRRGLAGRDLRNGRGRIEIAFLHALPAGNRLKLWKDFCGFLVLRGQGRYTDQEGRGFPLAPGCFALHPLDRWHDIQRQEPQDWIEWSLACDRETALLLQGLGLCPTGPPVSRPGLGPDLLLRLEGLATVLDDPGADQARCLLAFIDCLHALADPPAPADPMTALVQRAQRTLAGDQACRIDLEGWARAQGCSYIHFRRHFRRLAGCAPDAWRQRHRLEAARTLLHQPDSDVTSTARRLGYASPFSFSRQFKRRYGLSPSAWIAAGRR